jgi:hypothetical protein
MNPDLDLSAVKAFFQKLLGELREKRLWPVAAALLVAIVAVPVALSKSSSPTPVAAGPQPAPPPAQAASLPAISAQSTPSQSRISGRARDPFAQQKVTKSSTAATRSATTATTGATGASGSQTSGAGAAVTSGGATPTATTTGNPPPSITHGAQPKPAPTGLTDTQSYDVSLTITNASGGFDTIDPLDRLSVLPSAQTPMLVELGVQQGGQRVLFAVQPGTVVNGPGVCTPGPIDCEIVSLAQDQTEGLARQTSAGVVQGPLFAVTAITAIDHPSKAAAAAARRQEVAAGRSLIDKSPLTALSMFQYQPSLGAVVDLRNLAVGGN